MSWFGFLNNYNENEPTVYENSSNNRYYNNNNNKKNKKLNNSINNFSEEDLNALEVDVERLLNTVKKYPGNSAMPVNYKGIELPFKEGQRYKTETLAKPKTVFGKLPAHLQGGKRKTRKQLGRRRKTRRSLKK